VSFKPRRRTERLPNYDQNDGKPGVVYILANDALRDGIYKIGQSTRSGAHRARDFNITAGTGTPKLFRCIFEVRTLDCGRAEKAVHERLDANRLTKQEFFSVELEHAKQVIIEECARQVAPTVLVGVNTRYATEKEEWQKVAMAGRMQHLRNLNIQRETALQESQWRCDVRARMKKQGVAVGLKWASAWFAGSWVVFALMGVSSKIIFLCLILGFFAYGSTSDGPADDYLSSSDAQDELLKIHESALETVLIKEALDEALESV
jgi:hypothetical protein